MVHYFEGVLEVRAERNYSAFVGDVSVPDEVYRPLFFRGIKDGDVVQGLYVPVRDDLKCACLVQKLSGEPLEQFRKMHRKE